MSSIWKPGTFVWAKTDKYYWPAIIISHEDANMRKEEPGTVYVFWFGDKRISLVFDKDIVDFISHFLDIYKNNKRMGIKWFSGVINVIRELGMPHTVYIKDDVLIDYAKNVLIHNKNKNNNIENKVLPGTIKSLLDNRKNIIWKPYNTLKNKDFLKKAINENVYETMICIACFSKNVINDHPIFIGKLCEDCYEKLQLTLNIISCEDNYEYCTLCGNCGKMKICPKDFCERTFCLSCVSNYQGLVDEKYCSICRPKRKEELLKIKENWELEYQNLLSPGIQVGEICEIKYSVKKIFCIFKGNPSVLQNILNKTKTQYINIYDETKGLLGFTKFSNLNFDFQNGYLFDELFGSNAIQTVKIFSQIHKMELRELENVDLFIGGSSETALNLWKHEKLIALEIFLEFYRLLEEYMLNIKQIDFIFEMPASLPKFDIDMISRFLGKRPKLFRAENKQYILVWTNWN